MTKKELTTTPERLMRLSQSEPRFHRQQETGEASLEMSCNSRIIPFFCIFIWQQIHNANKANEKPV